MHPTYSRWHEGALTRYISPWHFHLKTGRRAGAYPPVAARREGTNPNRLSGDTDLIAVAFHQATKLYGYHA
eukprot:2239789-Rhodomonas_salina.2